MTLTLGFYDEKEDFFDLKGVVEELLSTMGMNEKLSYDANAGRPYLHPGRQANIIYNGKVLGFIGEVHPLVRANYNLGERTYIAVIDMPQVVEQASFDRKYTPITNFPASTRDLSLLTKKDMEVGEIEAVFDREGGQYLESYELFDVYAGAGIDPDYKSVAYSLTFRAKDKNLADTDVNEAMDRIINGLSAIDVNMRS
jgi:phenylalanyl-tRNA synthetase beta chain